MRPRCIFRGSGKSCPTRTLIPRTPRLREKKKQRNKGPSKSTGRNQKEKAERCLHTRVA